MSTQSLAFTAPKAIAKSNATDIEAAEFLGISPATLRRWRLVGGGPRWVKIGSSVRYPDLNAYIAGLPGGGGDPKEAA